MSLTPASEFHAEQPLATAPQDWPATRDQSTESTELARDEDDYLATPAERQDIGRDMGGDQHELFVSCDPAEALQQQFSHLNPEFIAIQDMGTTSSRQLLASVAAASHRQLQKLLIRRQGYGTLLATLDFLELPTGDDRPLRIYSTESDADTVQRHALARVLLAYSRLGVLMVGDMPVHQLKSSLEGLRDGMIGAAWPNRNLLLLPLASSGVLGTESLVLSRGTGVQVRTTPQVTRPADAWAFISGTWNRLREQRHPEAAKVAVAAARPAPSPVPLRAAPASPAATAVQPAPMKPMPEPRGAAPAGIESTLGRYVRRLNELTGMVSCCVFDIASARPLVHAGASPGPDPLATHGAALLAGLTSTSRTLGLGHALPEAAITLGAHHLLLRGVPKHPGVALHAVLDKSSANLTLARLQISRMDALFDEPTS